MVWKKIKASTSVDVEIDIDEVDTPTLLQALLNRGALRESEAESIAERRENDFATSGYPPPLEADDLGIAVDEIRRGNRQEALIWIERALGGDFVGRLAI